MQEESKRLLNDSELSKSLYELHSKVITKKVGENLETSKLDGSGVNIAFIDQGFDKNMSEFGEVGKGRYKCHMTCIKNEDGTYEIVERTDDRDYEDNFHGNTAADLAAGKKCGIAPNANVYFFEINSNNEDKDYNKRVKAILEYIKTNQKDLKLDVISHSAGTSEEVLKIADDIRDNYGCEYINSGVLWKNYFPGREKNGETFEAEFVESARAVPGVYENENGQFLKNEEAMSIPVEGRTSIQVIKDKKGNVEESRKYNGAMCGASYAIPQLVGWLVLARQMNPKISLEDFIAKTKELQHTNSKGKLYTNPIEVIEKMWEEQREGTIEDTIQQIIKKAHDSKLTGYELAKFVHIELGKAIYYDNNYSVKKDDEGNETKISKVRDKNMLQESTDSSKYSQICKGMAEIYARILNKLGIQAKAVGVAEKGLTHEVSVDEAKHYYTAFKIGEQEYAQDYLIESALARIKIGEAEIADIMPGICHIEEYTKRAEKGLKETKLSNDFLSTILRRRCK